MKKEDKIVNLELKRILIKFSESGWDLIDSVSKEYLVGEKNKDKLIEAIKKAGGSFKKVVILKRPSKKTAEK